MHPLRLLFFFVFGIFSFVILLGIGQSPSEDDSEDDQQRNPGPSFDWRAPSSSLFPPSAVISLTDDNSTFFLARPAAFGPLLPTKSLSGQLWIGSGFGDDQRPGRGGGGFSAGAEGELGCSDVPGWYDGDYLPRISSNSGKRTGADIWKTSSSPRIAGSAGSRKQSTPGSDADSELDDRSTTPAERDGTDDHLHHPLPASGGIKTNGESLRGSSIKTTHADIQSLQESAEIAGKIVLLSRGGCGFLEKVKWVQRRGGVALIVGDDVRGGQLVTMYARGDTSNVTIPALFTSHTTAHLLSSLIPAEKGVQPGRQEQAGSNKPDEFATSDSAERKSDTSSIEDMTALEVPQSWFRSLFGLSPRKSLSYGRRPPSSGSREWIYPNGKEDNQGAGDSAQTSTGSSKASPAPAAKKIDDGFVIGVHDWRDPDMVAQQSEDRQRSSGSAAASTEARTVQNSARIAKDGSSTPASGISESSAGKGDVSDEATREFEYQRAGESYGSSLGRLFRHFFSESHPDVYDVDVKDSSDQLHDSSSTKAPSRLTQHNPHMAHVSPAQQDDDAQPQLPPHREGLWITLSPTTMSSSPFFDTLLVLVVSPLVTLTVVYALLLLRARIRRRRWRAPKSVVEQLPVRTYHTIPPSTANTSPTASVILSPHPEANDDMIANAETPLLRSSTSSLRSISSQNHHHHQHARKASGESTTDQEHTEGGESPTSPLLRSTSASIPTASRPGQERPALASSSNTTSSAAALAEWRRRYGGKQRECVVCLEEYIDGVSRVMSLPCGHEFHVECMYVITTPPSPNKDVSILTHSPTVLLGSPLAAAPVQSAKETSFAPSPPHPSRPNHRHHPHPPPPLSPLLSRLLGDGDPPLLHLRLSYRRSPSTLPQVGATTRATTESSKRNSKTAMRSSFQATIIAMKI
jgi:hypothetical protein